MQQAAAPLLGDQGIPPEHAAGAGIKGEQGTAAEAAFRVVPRFPRRIGRLIDGRPGEVRRHVQHAIVHGWGEAVVDLALRRPAGIAGSSTISSRSNRYSRASRAHRNERSLTMPPGNAFSAGGDIDAAIRAGRQRPTRIRLRMSGERIPANVVGHGAYVLPFPGQAMADRPANAADGKSLSPAEQSTSSPPGAPGSPARNRQTPHLRRSRSRGPPRQRRTNS